jgi:UDP-2-acetamido-2-deoxy-ribo-hexuluronate aminotransferase
MEFSDLKNQYKELKNEIDQSIQDVLNHGRYIKGPEVQELEDDLNKYVASRNCITVANGTDALQIAMMSIGIEPNDEVIVPAFSYISTAEAICILGAKPVFVDVDSNSYNINPEKIIEKINKKTKAIIPVSLFGQCADFTQINKIAHDNRITVIEDAAQSFGAQYNSLKSCNLSDIACTSFFPTKPLGCYGDGGAIFTKRDDIAKIIRQIAVHGQDKKYHHIRVGLNSRLDSIQAAILKIKLRYLDEEIKKRLEKAKIYNNLIDQSKIKLPLIDKTNNSAWAQYTIQHPNREKLIKIFKNNDIPYAIYYPYPLNKQPAFKKYSTEKFVESEKLSNTVISLPIGRNVDESFQLKISEIINKSS